MNKQLEKRLSTLEVKDHNDQSPDVFADKAINVKIVNLTQPATTSYKKATDIISLNDMEENLEKLSTDRQWQAVLEDIQNIFVRLNELDPNSCETLKSSTLWQAFLT